MNNSSRDNEISRAGKREDKHSGTERTIDENFITQNSQVLARVLRSLVKLTAESEFICII